MNKKAKNTVKKTKKPKAKAKASKKSILTDSNTEDPTKKLTFAYVFALGLIAFLTVAVHVITAQITDQQRESAEVAYKIGRQRTLVQQVVLYANNYLHMGEAFDYDFMLQSLRDMEKSHQYVLQIVNKKNYSPALHRVYYSPPFNLDEHIAIFNTIIKEFAEYPAKTDSVNDYSKQREALINKINHKANNILRPAMDVALENYQVEALDKIVHFYAIQLGGSVFILIVLLAEAGLIFRPLIKKIKEYNTTMERYALEDALTGMNNRRAFMNGANTELKKAKREKSPITVALLDLDHFKKVNDTYGHEVGDRVLQHFSTILQKGFRAGDILGRIGGEEFAIVLPRINRKGAMHILQRFCDTIANTPCPYKDANGNPATLSYTVSIGVKGPSLITEHTIDGLLAEADEGLYAAKEKGRNCIATKADKLSTS